MRPEPVAAAELLRSGVTVRHIMSSDLFKLDPAQDARAAERELASLGFDQAPLDEQPIQRCVHRDDLSGARGPVSTVARPIVMGDVVSASAGLAQILPAFRPNGSFYYVLDDTGIAGIVTRADLQLPPVSMAVLGLITSLEIALSELIDIYSHGSWYDRLPERRRGKLDNRFAQRKQSNAEISMLECLDLVDRFVLVEQLDRLRSDLQLTSKRRARQLKRRIIKIRNPLAHGGSVVGACGDFTETLDIIEEIGALGELAWSVLAHGAYVWEAYANTRIEPIDSNRFNAIIASGEPVHVITAYNPHSRRRSTERNAAANERLRHELETNAQAIEVANCRSTSGLWAEPSFVVAGLTRAESVDIASRFGQRAVFEIQSDELLLIDCESGTERQVRPLVSPSSG